MSLQEPRSSFGLIAVHQCIYAIGGQNSNGQALATVHCYDPVIKIWHEVHPMLHARIGAAFARHRNLIVAAGGKDHFGVVLSSVECYDLIAEQWQPMSDLREPRVGAQLCSIGDSLYISGGSGCEDKLIHSVDCLNTTQTQSMWQLVDFMEQPRYILC